MARSKAKSFEEQLSALELTVQRLDQAASVLAPAEPAEEEQP